MRAGTLSVLYTAMSPVPQTVGIQDFFENAYNAIPVPPYIHMRILC